MKFLEVLKYNKETRLVDNEYSTVIRICPLSMGTYPVRVDTVADRFCLTPMSAFRLGVILMRVAISQHLTRVFKGV